MGRWLKDVTASISDSIAPYNQAYQKGILRTYNLFVKATPVNEGRHRQAWYIVKGTEAGPIYEDGGPGGGLSEINSITIFDAFTIYNAMGESALVLESGLYPNPGQPHPPRRKGQPAVLTTADGFSIQAPAGIVGVNIPRVRQIFQEEFESVGLGRAA